MNILEWRKREKLTQADAAERLGLSQGFLSKVERGSEVSLKMAADIVAKTGGAGTLDSFLGSETAA